MKQTPECALVPGVRTGISSSFQSNSTKGVDEKIYDLFRQDLDPLVDEFVRAMSGLEVSNLSANRTGRWVIVRIKVFGRSVRFTVASSRRIPSGIGIRYITSELIRTLSSKKLAGSSLLQDISMMDAIHVALKPKLSQGQFYSQTVLDDILNKEVLHRLSGTDWSVPRLVLDSVNEFVSAGRHLDNFNDHHRKKAIESLRKMAHSAFRHGAKFDDLVNVLQEEMVRSIMEG